MGASITLAGEDLIAQMQGAQQPLTIARFIFANVPGLDPNGPVDRAASKPPAEHIVYNYQIPPENRGYVNPSQVIYSAQIGSDVGDWDFNWIGLESVEGILFAVTYMPLQQKRRNIPPLQVGNNLTRNFLVVFDGAQELTGISIDASTWQHDFTVRFAGIDERERQSNRDVYGRACFFGGSLQLEKVGAAYQIKPGIAYIEGIRLERVAALSVAPPGFPTTAWLDVALQRELSDVVASWNVVWGTGKTDYTDSAGVRHYCVPLAELPNSTTITDLRPTEPVSGPLVAMFAFRTGDYAELRARATTKEDVGLDALPNAKSDDPASNSSEILATTAALNAAMGQVVSPLAGMIAAFARNTPPTGWMKANGAAISRTTYAALFAAIGTTFGAGDGATTFNLPDMRGEFLRGWDDGRGIDSGRAFGSFQDQAYLSHAHTASVAADTHTHAWSGASSEATTSYLSNVRQVGGSAGAITVPPAGESPTGVMVDGHSVSGPYGVRFTNSERTHTHASSGTTDSYSHTHGVTVNAAGQDETRPRNSAHLYCIKY